MAYTLEISPEVDKVFLKLQKKNQAQMSIITKKLGDIVENPQHYKNLRSPMQHLKRVHIDKSFVMVFSVDEAKKHIIIEDFDHHDKIYL